MKKLLLLIFLGWVRVGIGQIPVEHREELDLNRHEQRIRANGISVTEEMSDLVKDQGHLDAAQKKALSAVLESGNPLQIEWLICESRDAYQFVLDAENLSGVQFAAVCQAFIDYSASKVVPGGAEEYGLWNGKPIKLAARVAKTMGVEPPGKSDYFVRESAIAWLRKNLTAYQSESSTLQEMRAACKLVLDNIAREPAQKERSVP